MADYNTSAEFNDNEILNKVDYLLHKHQNPVKAHEDPSNTLSPKLDYTSMPDGLWQQTTQPTNKIIPTLTEVVILHPVTPPAPDECTLSLQQILDASLQEVGIDLNIADRFALVHALKKRIDVVS